MDDQAKPQIIVLQIKRCSLGWLYSLRVGQGPHSGLLTWRTHLEDAIEGPKQDLPNGGYAKALIEAIANTF